MQTGKYKELPFVIFACYIMMSFDNLLIVYFWITFLWLINVTLFTWEIENRLV